ncbi:MAG TPA: response regulator transcription factor [Candidatus Merdenecus merdavium]|nr:response regulator transcription factor [Candidatus Merdenecus merdavium]
MIYIAICDDDNQLLNTIHKKVKSYLIEMKEIADVTTYTQSRNLQFDIEEGKHFDLILSDIEMPHVDGMELADYVKKFLPEVLIIFITSHLKYAIDAFSLSIFRYIPKNMLDTRLRQSLDDAFRWIKLQADKYYVIEMPTRVEKVSYNRILYIQRDGKNSAFILNDNSVTKVRKSLSQVFKELNSVDFIYVTRGEIVNLAYIMKIQDGVVELTNGERILASQSRLEEIKFKLSEFWEKQV